MAMLNNQMVYIYIYIYNVFNKNDVLIPWYIIDLYLVYSIVHMQWNTYIIKIITLYVLYKQ